MELSDHPMTVCCCRMNQNKHKFFQQLTSSQWHVDCCPSSSIDALLLSLLSELSFRLKLHQTLDHVPNNHLTQFLCNPILGWARCGGASCSLALCELSFFLPSFTGVFVRCLLCMSLHTRIFAWKNSGRGTNLLTNMKELALPLPRFFQSNNALKIVTVMIASCSRLSLSARVFCCSLLSCSCFCCGLCQIRCPSTCCHQRHGGQLPAWRWVLDGIVQFPGASSNPTSIQL
jgi:hypothetical protein